MGERGNTSRSGYTTGKKDWGYPVEDPIMGAETVC